jgi:CBS domain-containing protein
LKGIIMPHTALPTFRFPEGTCIAQAMPKQHDHVSLNSPAVHVMTDLAAVRAATIEPRTSLAQAEQRMIHQGVRLLFVVSEMPCVDGVVTARDLQGDKPLRLVNQRQVKHSDLTVLDVMTPLSEIDAVDYASLERAKVSDVITTLLKFGRPHLLVIEDATEKTAARIRGIISQTQLERQLGKALPATEIATTFAEIEQALL